jgi:hypothetical protein
VSGVREAVAPRGRSAEQRQGSAALAEVMRAWEDLTDTERLAWRTYGQTQRRRGEELARIPPPPKPYDDNNLLRELEIHNHAGRITLKLHLHRLPNTPRTVWGAFPCNRGLEKPDKCPRLGWLPPTEDGVTDITAL